MESLIENLDIYRYLSEQEKELLNNGVSSQKYAKGEQIHGMLDTCKGLLVVKSGKLRAYILSEEGKEITLYYLGGGDICIMTASCALNNLSFDIHIEADTDVEVAQINTPTFSQLLKNIYVQNFALKLTVDRFSDVMWSLSDKLFTSVDKRIIAFLLSEARKTNSKNIYITHEEIAKKLGTAREVVTRILGALEKDGAIALSRGKLSILDSGVLKLRLNM